MKTITPGLLWRLTLPHNKFELNLDGKDFLVLNKEKIHISHHSTVSIRRNFFFSSLVFRKSPNASPFLFKGLSKNNSDALCKYINKIIQEKIEIELEKVKLEIKPLLEKLTSIKGSVDRFLGSDKYITGRDAANFINSLDYKDAMERSREIRDNPLFAKIEGRVSLDGLCNYLLPVFEDFGKTVSQRNDGFVGKEIKKYNKLFGSIESNPLTDEQATGAVIMEENNLVVAAAGSGKTSVIMGKVAYALQKGLFKPEEIVCIAFNKKAAEEMKNRLESKSPIVSGINEVKAQTFHSFGLSVIREIENKVVAGQEETRSYIDKALNSLLESDLVFKANYFLLKTTINTENTPASDFETKEEYERYLNSVRKNRHQDKGIKTLSGHFVRSLEEVGIANWLYIHGIDFKYEKEWKEVADKLNWGVYRPDFYYPGASVYHEHFALDHKGRAPAFFNSSDREYYEVQARKKIEVMKKLSPNSFYTTSADCSDGTIFKKLEEKMKSLGLNPAIKDPKEIDKKIKEIGKTWIDTIILRGISLIKSNGFTKKDLLGKIGGQKDKIRAFLFIEVVMSVINKYNEILSNENKIDYADMISLAGKYLSDGAVRMPYKFMLIDEFQDITQGEAKMIKASLKHHKDGILFGVGDDWQAINGFAGSDLNIFNGFESYFGSAKEVYLTKTFRSNQGISDIASAFVQEDGFLKRKKVGSINGNRKKVIEIKTFKKDTDINRLVNESIESLTNSDKSGNIPSVFILSRYTIANTIGLSGSDISSIEKKYKGTCDVKFSTIHGSKGLEADYVIITGLFNESVDWKCFPGVLECDPLLDLILPGNKSGIDRPEERRLFYVALTRAKNKAVLLTKEEGYSEYISSILKQPNNGEILFEDYMKTPIMDSRQPNNRKKSFNSAGNPLKTAKKSKTPKICPSCKTGHLIERQNHLTGHRFLGCSNYSEGCEYSEQVQKKPRNIKKKPYRYVP